jgi:hypothetical protein
VDEVHLTLNGAVLDLILRGDDVVVPIENLRLRVVIRGDDELVAMRQHMINMALMQSLPTPRSIN